MNMNEVAKEVTMREGGKVNLSIAQVKEVLRIYNDLLANNYFPADVIRTIGRYEK
jgi:hypothetical protein